MSSFVGYDYKEITAEKGKISMYLDCYKSFGWERDENFPAREGRLRLKRDRKIPNKMELTRLQRNFEACVKEIAELEKSKTSYACGLAVAAGLIGTAFMAGSVFAVTHEPPIIWLCALLGAAGIAGWILPRFIYKKAVESRAGKVAPLIEEKYEEIYEVCEKGHSLL